jgi:FkbM family methyltransferase
MLENFNWGGQSKESQDYSIKEIFIEKTYSKVFDVEEGDVVVDMGASSGIFSYSILDKKPSNIYLIEPITEHIKLIYDNLRGSPFKCVQGVISERKKVEPIAWGDFYEENITTYSFEEFLKYCSIDKIDFLKVDIEGEEYDVFKESLIPYLLTVPKIVCEFHLWSETIHNCKFRFFRDNILPHFPNYYVFALDGVDIKWDLYNEHFLEYYQEVIFHFDNR